MSNFQTFGAVTEGLEGSAPARFVASTTDSFAVVCSVGYLNDKAKIVKANDKFDINYADTSVFPLNTGEASLFGSFTVQYDPTSGNFNLIPSAIALSTISSLGVHASTYSYGGGSATLTITDAAINPNSIVVARWQSAGTAQTVETVNPGLGSFTVVSTGNPGVSVLEYISVLPSVPLMNAGVHATTYAYAGGGTSIVITDAAITASSVVNANFVSQTNASKIASVTATAGTLTIVVNTNPGASVIAYTAVTPSSALTADGLYGAQYTNAGGSATTTITDTTIGANSIVTADWSSQTNASYIEKVTPSSNTLTILSNTDPGASVLSYTATPSAEGSPSGVYLLATNNLSDVASAPTALSNLGAVPSAGGTLTGKVTFQKGTGSGATPTVSAQSGVVTTASLSTAAAATATATTITNTLVTSTSVILVSLMGGTNTIPGVSISAVPTTNTITVSVTNNNVAGSALNGTLIIGFVVL